MAVSPSEIAIPEEELEDEQTRLGAALAQPVLPSAAEIAAHEVSHIPYRAWCTSCVRGRAKSQPHRTSHTHQDDKHPVVSIDYAFFSSPQTEGGDAATTGSEVPVLIVFDRRTKCVFAHLLKSKAADDTHAADVLLQDLQKLGYSTVILKSDQEPSIKALMLAVKRRFVGTLILEWSPVGQSKSNGEVERAVQSVHGMTRTLKEFTELKIKKMIGGKSPILAWMVQHASFLMNTFGSGGVADGLTPYSRWRGRAWKIQLPAFGENVEYMKRTKTKLDSRWHDGIFLGIKDSSSEKMIGTPEGVLVVQSIRRKPAEEAWSAESIEKVSGVPWKPTPTPDADRAARDLPREILLPPANPTVEAKEPEAHKPVQATRSLYIRKTDLLKYGYTESCRACEETAAGIPRRGGVLHTDECRRRIEERILSDPDQHARVDATADKNEGQTGKRTRFTEIAEGEHPPTITMSSSSAPTSGENPQGEKRGAPSETEHRTVRAALGSTVPTTSSSSRLEAAGATSSTEPSSMEVDHKKRSREESGDVTSQLDPRLVDYDSGDEGLLSEIIGEIGSDNVEHDLEEFVREANEREIAKAVGRDPVRPVPEGAELQEFLSQHLDYEKQFYDTSTECKLPTPLVHEAMTEELTAMVKMKVWRDLEENELLPSDKVITTRWVIVNKGEDAKPLVRARLVAREIKGRDGSSADTFAATPPLDALRMMVSIAASNRDYCMDFIDIKKAHLNGKITRRVILQLPAEMGYKKVLLLNNFYGTRDAAKSWESCVRVTMEGIGFVAGRSCPCTFFHPERVLRTIVHGDDFVAVGKYSDCCWLRQHLKNAWELKIRGAIGHEVEEISILGRMIRKREWGYSYEADPKHCTVILREAGLTSLSKSVTSPGVKESDDDDQDLLPYEEARQYRSLVMRAAYLSLDRPDLQFATKEAARTMQTPRVCDRAKLQRIARYLLLRPRLVYRFEWQPLPKHLYVECDSDFAGCNRTRKSTSGNATFMGHHLISTRSKTQSVLALSTAEAEFYSLCSTMSSSLGIQSLAMDLGLAFSLVKVGMDATAGMAMASRRGLGKAKHISVRFLWVQDHTSDGSVKLVKVPGEDNTSDLMTKHVPGVRILHLIEKLRLSFPTA